ncbi:MAG: aspartate aminotransferase family protein [Micromonosporaceae bacterium]
MTVLPDLRKSSAVQLRELDLRHVVHPHQQAARTERCVIVRGQGCTVWDADGNEYLDATGSANWAAQVGHGRRELVEVAARQMSELAYFTSWDVFTNDKAVRLASRLAELAPPGLDRVFFTCGGSEGVETAVKAARLYHHRRGQPDRTWIIGRHFGYHGSTYGSGTITGLPPMHAEVGPALPHVEKVSAPALYRAAELYGGQDPTDFLISELTETIERIGPERVAAMIGEPVMGGGGGILVPPVDYWPRVRELLSRYGILLIADEVVTAFGRTGAWFDSAERGMSPDIIVTAKGITSGYVPLGAVVLSGGISDELTRQAFFHGFTYFGHPLACAVALKNLEIIDEEGLVGRSLLIGDWFRAALAPAAQLPVVGDIRVAGATVGIELVTDKDTKTPLMAGGAAAEIRHAHGVIVRDYGPTLVLSPPLVLEKRQAERAATAIIEVLSRVDGDGRLAPR